MSELLKIWTPEDVQNAKDKSGAFCKYLQQSIGIPFPTGKDIAIVRKKAREFFELYPHTDWRTLCRVAIWCKARKKRLSRPWMVIDQHRGAWAAGFIPELNAPERVDLSVEEAITEALQLEDREGWRRRLVMAQGPERREKVLLEWKSDRLTSSTSH